MLCYTNEGRVERREKETVGQEVPSITTDKERNTLKGMSNVTAREDFLTTYLVKDVEDFIVSKV